MEKLQNQLDTLNGKVDLLYQLVEKMSSQLAGLLAGQNADVVEALQDDRAFATSSSSQNITKLSKNQRVSTPIGFPSSPAIAPQQDSIFHKDVLADEQNLDRLLDYNTDERSLSPDLQIRRLTAQVTAAYNRIAALEEQLLATRGDRDRQKFTLALQNSPKS
ncbi:hypothetical protein [Spirulina sp. 06S082]|uniref:hypothetical protein n=1 Tax=Spirulina sp. 06S082 TaxID=3110248 RepID=UPI002B210329|nr:hypothetical protein [Spirulina sp. 06S082]MEA5468891.1 hypothetical protein [Spirulina sp. 06S082]